MPLPLKSFISVVKVTDIAIIFEKCQSSIATISTHSYTYLCLYFSVFDVSPLMLHADPLFTGHHPFRSMDYTSTMESGYINTGNGMSLEDIVNFEDLISNNMSALSENLSSSLSMST